MTDKIRFGDKPLQDFDKAQQASEPQVIRTDSIECPVCLTVQQADVVWDERDLWPIYVHTCSRCNYIILESEWTVIK